MTIINFDKIIGKEYKTITNSKYCLNHPTNTLIVGKTNFGKTNILFNLMAQNSIYEKKNIYTNNIDDKYSWLKNKFKNDVHIFINEINFDKISKDKINLVVFDDLVFSNKKISEFFTKSRKLNVSCVFISHRYFCIDRLLRNNLDYILFTKLDKKEIKLIDNDISLYIDLNEFEKINNDLERYDFIIVDKYNKYDFMRIRTNIDQIHCK